MKYSHLLIGAATLTAMNVSGCQNSSSVVPNVPSNTFAFRTIQNIGSIVDPINGDQNPYGLAIAPVSAGKLSAGDLVVCNFNDAAGVEGNGTTVVSLHPTPGATPARFAQSPSLKGCGELSTALSGNVVVGAKLANDVAIIDPSGAILSTLPSGPWNAPWGTETAAGLSAPAIYVANANDGTIIRATLGSGGSYVFSTIATGFSVNGGLPGNILAPYGLSYNPVNDTLYIDDSNLNRIVAISSVSGIPANGISVSGAGFSGPSASNARVVFSGAPLNLPFGSALLANGYLVIVNSGDNRLSEISPDGRLIGSMVLDAGPAGALFDLAATVKNGQPVVYFDDSNDNTVKMLTP